MRVASLTKLSFVLCAALSLSFVFPAVSWARILNPELPKREGAKLGEAVFHSALTTSLQHESNIFLSDSGEKSDLILMLNPSAGLELPIQENSFSVEYDAFINDYLDHDDENHVDHRLDAKAEIGLTDYTISITDLYNRFTSRADSEVSAKIRQQANEARIGIAAEFEQLGFEAGYTNKYNDYRSSDIIFGALTYDDRDYTANIIDLVASYAFMPKTAVLLESDFGTINYDNSVSPDADFIELLLGLRGEPDEDLTVDLKAGIKHQEYDTSSLLNDENFTGFIARGGVNYGLTDDDLLSLKLERGIYESTYQNMNYYTLSGAGLTYRHDFNDKLSVDLLAALQLNDYPGPSTEGGDTREREDKFYSLGGGIAYHIQKWLSAQATYKYTNRDSNFATYDYEDNVIVLSLTAGF